MGSHARMSFESRQTYLSENESGADANNEYAGEYEHLGGFLGAAQIRPIHIGAQFLAGDCPGRFTLYVYAEAFTKTLIDRNCLAEIANRGVAPTGKVLLIYRRKVVDVGEKRFHWYTLPVGKSYVNNKIPVGYLLVGNGRLKLNNG